MRKTAHSAPARAVHRQKLSNVIFENSDIFLAWRLSSSSSASWTSGHRSLNFFSTFWQRTLNFLWNDLSTKNLGSSTQRIMSQAPSILPPPPHDFASCAWRRSHWDWDGPCQYTTTNLESGFDVVHICSKQRTLKKVVRTADLLVPTG